MLPLLLLLNLHCAAFAALPDSSESTSSCLLQTGRQRHPSQASQGPRSGEEHTEHVHSLEADAHDVSMSAQGSTALSEVFETAGKPYGDAEMHKTNMNQDDLPKGSRHIDSKTWTSDWSSEYPPFVRSVTPELVAPLNSWGTPAAVPAWPCWLLGLCTRWLVVLALLGCLILVLLLCCLAFVRGRGRKQSERFPVRAAPWDRAFVQSSYEVYVPPVHNAPALAEQTLSPQHHENRLVPMARVGVDSTGDGRSNYTYTGIDQNYDGVPDALQDGQILDPTDTSVVDASHDGHPNYLYTMSEQRRDDTPDSLQVSQDSLSENQEVQQEAVMDHGSSSSALSEHGDQRDSVICSFPQGRLGENLLNMSADSSRR